MKLKPQGPIYIAPTPWIPTNEVWYQQGSLIAIAGVKAHQKLMREDLN